MVTRVSTEFSQLAVIAFDGEKYEFWSKQTKAYLVAMESWDVVSNDYVEYDKQRKSYEN